MVNDVVEIRRDDLIHVLNSLKQLTLAAYDGKAISRNDIEAIYKLLIDSATDYRKEVAR